MAAGVLYNSAFPTGRATAALAKHIPRWLAPKIMFDILDVDECRSAAPNMANHFTAPVAAGVILNKWRVCRIIDHRIYSERLDV